MGLTLGEASWVLALGVVAAAISAVTCRRCLMADRTALQQLWGDIRPLLRHRCQLVGTLTQEIRELSDSSGAAFAEDIDYLLELVDGTEHPHEHAGIQNGLVLTVQRGLEHYYRLPEFREARGISDAMDAISLVDSRLAPLRDRYNDRINRYNSRLKKFPFSLVGRAERAKERSLFLMLIPWWSTDEAAFGGVSAEEIKQMLETWKAPMVVAPRRRPGGTKKEEDASGTDG
jgi:LemA protein